mmetsp:Transcript_5128/g.10994  ORF Transcript_5128/g.10994 Transcript_5128/m.10994 type:complete len:225 (+) Transcript_5128:796-1470(+)
MCAARAGRDALAHDCLRGAPSSSVCDRLHAYSGTLGRVSENVDHLGSVLDMLPIPPPNPVFWIVQLRCLCVPYGSGPLSLEHAGLSAGLNRPPSGSIYRLRSRALTSSLPKRSASRISCLLLPAIEVMVPPRWNRFCRRFSDHRLPSATWYGSRKTREGNDWLARAIAAPKKKSRGAVEIRPCFIVSTAFAVDCLCITSKLRRSFGAARLSSGLEKLAAHLPLC